MVVFLDTNVVLDVALQRPQFVAESTKGFEICERSENSAYIAWHTLSNCFYLLAKAGDSQMANAFLLDLLDQVEVGPVSTAIAKRAFLMALKDSEDAMQIAFAEAIGADVIVTRNEKDFVSSPISVKSPLDFIHI